MSSRRPPRPVRVARPTLVLALLALAFFGIARTTGSGWIVVLLCGVVGTLVAAALWPLVGLRRVDVRLAVPRDGTVGRPLPATVSVASGGAGLVVRLLDPAGPAVVADPPARGEVLLTPERRGVVDAVPVEVVAAGPLGLVAWRRTLTVPLDAPLEVGPRPADVSLAELLGEGAGGTETATRGRKGHDLVRSVRDYVPGDPIRLVHWPATARWGEVMVKETEDPDVPRLAVVVDLRGDPRAAEERASVAAGLVVAALGAGVPVTLLTAEREGGVVAGVDTPLDAGRRLARAVAGAPPEGPLPDAARVVRLPSPGARAAAGPARAGV